MGELQRAVLGRTGLEVTVMGLGCGGYSRLGLGYDREDAQAEAVVRHAVDRGVNVIDTAEAYGTETHVGRAVRDFPRDRLVLCTKAGARDDDGVRGPDSYRQSIENSLRNLGTDYIDVYAVHGLRIDDYDEVVATIVPELIRQIEKGNIRYIGVTEGFGSDTPHTMLARASRDDFWDTMMTGFNVINQSARELVCEPSSRHGVGVFGMFAVRHALSDPGNLKPVIEKLIGTGEVSAEEIDLAAPLDFALAETDKGTLAEVAYRFAVQEPGIHSVLSGTGSIEHLDANLDAAIQGPLSAATVEKLQLIFANVRSESGRRPTDR
jgi:aryl-alcohol dehydrogenase-like predicted oxidoreductase